ncbi:lipoxygenase [Mycena floridula]|nr:lipoxygenase [Mycena floridula]
MDRLSTSLIAFTVSARQKNYPSRSIRTFTTKVVSFTSIIAFWISRRWACDAFFFIHPVCGDFLPLAIRPNNGSPLVYTPLDGQEDWQLGKLLFNQNDLWWGQWYHLVATHEVIDLVYQMVVRTFSAEHPVFALMTRLAHPTFSFRVIAMEMLLASGGYVDRIFSWNGSTAAEFSGSLYLSWRSCKFGPALKSFPFYSDANNSR